MMPCPALVEDVGLLGPLLHHPKHNVHEVTQGTPPLKCATLLDLFIETFKTFVKIKLNF